MPVNIHAICQNIHTDTFRSGLNIKIGQRIYSDRSKIRITPNEIGGETCTGTPTPKGLNINLIQPYTSSHLFLSKAFHYFLR